MGKFNPPADRPLRDKTTPELWDILGSQLAAPRRYDGTPRAPYVTAYGDAHFGVDLAASHEDYTVVYRHTGSGYEPVMVKDSKSKPVASLESGKAKVIKPEDPIRWLHRRIAEVCWSPPR